MPCLASTAKPCPATPSRAMPRLDRLAKPRPAMPCQAEPGHAEPRRDNTIYYFLAVLRLLIATN